tara:strand:+ start:4937 stop:6184 length:1248 start_codon:yes stop_codon:yes gene_type:complete
VLTQEQIKKLLVEEFSNELNEFFGSPETTQIKTSLANVLGSSIRKKVIDKIASGITDTNAKEVKDALVDYYTKTQDKEILGFLLAFTTVRENLGDLKSKLTKLRKKDFTDLALIRVPQILKKAGIDIGLSTGEMTDLKALSAPLASKDTPTPSSAQPDTTTDTTQQFAVPVYKKHSGADQARGAPQGSLVSQLVKMFAKDFGNVGKDKMKAVLTAIANDVTKQLKGNKIQIQEEDIINEVNPKVTKDAIKTLNDRKSKGKYAVVKLRQLDNGKLVGTDNIWTAFMPSGEKKEFDARKFKLPPNWNDKKRKPRAAARFLIKKAKEAAEAWAQDKIRKQKLHKDRAQRIKIKVTPGKVDIKQSVARRLKNAGIDLAKGSAGEKLVQDVLSTIEQFLQSNMKRLGREDIKIVSERKSL